MGSPPYGNKKDPPKGEPLCLVIAVYCLSGEAFENIRMSYFGVSPLKGGEKMSLEEKIKLAIAVLQLLLALAELIRILCSYL
jgi:hypothetical protein